MCSRMADNIPISPKLGKEEVLWRRMSHYIEEMQPEPCRLRRTDDGVSSRFQNYPQMTEQAAAGGWLGDDSAPLVHSTDGNRRTLGCNSSLPLHQSRRTHAAMPTPPSTRPIFAPPSASSVLAVSVRRRQKPPLHLFNICRAKGPSHQLANEGRKCSLPPQPSGSPSVPSPLPHVGSKPHD